MPLMSPGLVTGGSWHYAGRMYEALPVLYRFLLRNLSDIPSVARTGGLGSSDERAGLVQTHATWLGGFTKAMGACGGFTISVRFHGHHADRAAGSPPFQNEGMVLEMVEQDFPSTAFAGEMAQALVQLEPEINLGVATSEGERLAWLARWLAGAALTAYARLLPVSGGANIRASLIAPIGEVVTALDALVDDLIQSLPAEVVMATPLYLAAVVDGAKQAVAQMKADGAALLGGEHQLSAGVVRSIRARLAHLSCYMTRVADNEFGKRVSHRHTLEHVAKTLSTRGICSSLEAAAKLVDLLRVETFTKTRFNVEVHRGKHEHQCMVARACERRGLRTPALMMRLFPNSENRAKAAARLDALVEAGPGDVPRAILDPEVPDTPDLNQAAVVRTERRNR